MNRAGFVPDVRSAKKKKKIIKKIKKIQIVKHLLPNFLSPYVRNISQFTFSGTNKSACLDILAFFATREKRATMAPPSIKLNSGYDMPQVGFGLWKVDNATCADTVYNAVKAGYRLFDGACGKQEPIPTRTLPKGV